VDAVPAEQRELVGEERNVQERDDGLGPDQGQRAQPGALAPGEDDGAYPLGVQGSASLISITGMPSRMG